MSAYPRRSPRHATHSVRPSLFVVGLGLAALLFTTPALAQQGMPSVAEKTADMQAIEGFFDLYWDDTAGKLYLGFDASESEFIYSVSMGSGLGSNPVGIDRGQLGGAYILRATRVGPRVLLIEPNYQYRARSDNALEVQAVQDAFASSVHWGFDIVARTGDRVLVDATSFFLRDARGAAEQMRRAGQGTFALDAGRSAVYMPAVKSFPDNTEVEAMLTFTTSQPGRLVNEVAATGQAVTLRQHHSFVRLPDDGFRTRVADPRVGVNGPTVYDYATPIDTDLRVRWVARHRLEKRNPNAARSEAIEPIVYYVDPGVPEPIRSALIEGASWWNDAYEAAGFINAFRVEVLPEGVDPQDVRYNMIHWTHRRTRGYSYGSTVADPRTGEIIKGNVNLGSLRLRQDYLHGQGMVAPFPSGTAQYYEQCGLADAPSFDYLSQVADDPAAVQMALARVRQLSAHEVGHTLGFPHNYMASAYGRESVMDYPAPLVEIENGRIDLSNAYLQRIGEYDKLSVKWLYSQFPAGTDEEQALQAIAAETIERGLIYMGHTNNNFIGAGHQYASVWDNGSNLVDHLKHEIEVRRIGLANFGPQSIRIGEPMSNLEQVLLPLYMHHRFQLRSAVQSLGGADYRYALRGDGQTTFTIIAGEEQRDALETVLSTLTVDFLALPERIIAMIPPPAYRYADGELFEGYTELLFDPLGAAEASAAFSVGEVLHSARMARLVVFGSMGDYPGVEEVVDRLVQVTWGAAAPGDEYRTQVLHVIQRVTADEMMLKATRDDSPAEVRAVLSDRLDKLAVRLEGTANPSPHQRAVAADIRRWQTRPESTIPAPKLELPAGDPIGGSPRGGSPGN